MKITVITLFPKMIESFVSESILKRAQEKGIVEIEIVNLRDFATDSYKTVDDRPYGGGAGMVIKVDVVDRALQKILSLANISHRAQLVQNSSSQIKINQAHSNTQNSDFDESGLQTTDSIRNTANAGHTNTRLVLTSAKGNVFDQKKAQEYAQLDHLVILAGHYEGFDHRINEMVDEEVSIGDVVLTGGEIPAVTILDSVVRLIPGVLKKEQAPQEESFFYASIDQLIESVGEKEVLQKLKSRGVEKVQLLEYPHYTRPEEFNGQRVPEVLLSGNHAEIEKWRLQQAYAETKKKRPDLLTR